MMLVARNFAPGIAVALPHNGSWQPDSDQGPARVPRPRTGGPHSRSW
jgi:hypothetical protein